VARSHKLIGHQFIGSP